MIYFAVSIYWQLSLSNYPEACLPMDSSAQLPAKYEGEDFFSAKLFFTPNTSHLKESAELCPGCNCPMDETTDYQLVLTRRSSSRFAKIAISSQTNKLPILHVYPSQNSFIMLCFFFWTICVRQKILIFAQPIKTQLSLNICLNNSTSSQTAHLHVQKNDLRMKFAVVRNYRMSLAI